MHFVHYICSMMVLLSMMTTEKAAQLSRKYESYKWVIRKHVVTDRREKFVIAGSKFSHIVEEKGCFLSPKENLVFRRLSDIQDCRPRSNFTNASWHRYTGALFNAEDGSLVKTFTPIELNLFETGGTCVWNQQGTFIAEYQKKSLRIWNVETGRIHVLECNDDVEGVAWCPNGRYIAAIGNQTITFIDAFEPGIKHTQRGTYYKYKKCDEYPIRWNDSGTTICFKNFDNKGKTYVYRVKEGVFEPAKQIDNVTSFEWIDDFRLAVLMYYEDKRQLKIIDTRKSSAFEKEFELSDSDQNQECLQKVGTTFFWAERLLSSEKRKIVKFDAYHDQKPVDFTMIDDGIGDSTFFILNKTLLVYDEDVGQLCFYDLQSGKRLKVIESPFKRCSSCIIKISPDKNYVAFYRPFSRQPAAVVDCRTYEECMAVLGKIDLLQITMVSWTSSGKLVSSFSDNSGGSGMVVSEPQTAKPLNSQVVKRAVASDSPTASPAPAAPHEPFAGGVWNWMTRYRKPLCFMGCALLLATVGYWGIKYRAYLKNKPC